ncbi:MAG TPA: ABC transporter permease subunit [Ktedonosporobacter sp.]|nr:ABC transporter permease subunit [Ktedonosporobacter sp.]
MNWVIWRQYRIEALIGVLVLVLLIIWLGIDGLVTRSAYQSLGMVACVAQHPHTTYYDCEWPLSDSVGNGQLRSMVATMTYFLPILVAVFVGALLVSRERERQTNYLAWSQSVTRTHWLAVKLSWVTSITLMAFLAVNLLLNWWSAPWISLSSDGPWVYYDQTGFVMLGFALFGLMLGVAVGTVIGKTVPAMLLTLLLFILFSVGMQRVYLHFIPPQSQFFSAVATVDENASVQPGDMTLHTGYADQQGQEIGDLAVYCGFHSNPLIPQADDKAYQALANQCIQTHHLQWKVVYQPPERVWQLQAIETAILLALASVLACFSFWWVRRRIC